MIFHNCLQSKKNLCSAAHYWSPTQWLVPGFCSLSTLNVTVLQKYLNGTYLSIYGRGCWLMELFCFFFLRSQLIEVQSYLSVAQTWLNLRRPLIQLAELVILIALTRFSETSLYDNIKYQNVRWNNWPETTLKLKNDQSLSCRWKAALCKIYININEIH